MFSACLEAVFRRVSDFAAAFRKEGGMTCSAVPGLTCSFGFTRVGGMEAAAVRKGAMSCSFGLVCRTSAGDDWPLWASDQMVLTIDGGKVYVTQL